MMKVEQGHYMKLHNLRYIQQNKYSSAHLSIVNPITDSSGRQLVMDG